MNTTRYIAHALDPIHVGAGGQRIGRVDMPVMREPATRVPMIAGPGISGAAKFFADYALRDARVKTIICAGTKGSSSQHENGRDSCPTCYAFGYTPDAGQNGASARGILDFTDALLVAYPVNTLVGPVWITTKPRLHQYLGLTDGTDDGGDTFALTSDSQITPINDRLNFGWALLQRGVPVEISGDQLAAKRVPAQYSRRVVVVAEWLFSHLVNDNMDVRTSVVIDPDTGAAKSTGLFTYEAVSRGALFCFSITEHDYRNGWANVNWNGKTASASATAMLVEKAFLGLKAVGLGGMTTRGFGRVAIEEIPNG